MRELRLGSAYLRDLVNEELQPAVTYTASGAIPITESGLHRLLGAGALAMTVAAPSANQLGVELEISQHSGVAATVEVTGMDTSATADLFTLPVASATSRPVLVLKCRNVGTSASPSYKWVALLSGGVTVA